MELDVGNKEQEESVFMGIPFQKDTEAYEQTDAEV